MTTNLTLRTPATPGDVTDEWLAVALAALAASEHASMLEYPDLALLAVSGGWLFQQLKAVGWPSELAGLVCRSHGEVWQRIQRDPWEIAVASLEAARRNPPPPWNPGEPLPVIVVMARECSGKAENTSDFGVF